MFVSTFVKKILFFHREIRVCCGVVSARHMQRRLRHRGISVHRGEEEEKAEEEEEEEEKTQKSAVKKSERARKDKFEGVNSAVCRKEEEKFNVRPRDVRRRQCAVGSCRR